MNPWSVLPNADLEPIASLDGLEYLSLAHLTYLVRHGVHKLEVPGGPANRVIGFSGLRD